MKSLYLDPITKDLAITSTGNLRFTQTDTEYVAQKIETKLSFFIGEWWLNVDLGIPYYEQILVKNPDLNIVNGLFIRELNSIPEIVEIVSFNASFDTSARKYSANFEVRIESGEIIEGSV